MTGAAATSRDRVLILGGSGFLGSHVADAFSDADFDVVVFDRAPSPHIRPSQTMVVGDLLDIDAVRRVTEGCRFVLNFAGIADIGDANRDAVRTASVNVLGTVHTLEAASRAGVERYCFASTVYVYAAQGGMYKASKQAAECFIEAFHREHGLEFTILRYGTLYGRRADARNRVHVMLRAALEAKHIDYPGSAGATREFIHVEDAAKLTLRATIGDYANRHLILTGQEKLTIGELLETIRELMGRKITWSCASTEPAGHYMLTPYAFQPQLGHKLVPDDYIDLGQGLLDCLSELVESSEQFPADITGPTQIR